MDYIRDSLVSVSIVSLCNFIRPTSNIRAMMLIANVSVLIYGGLFSLSTKPKAKPISWWVKSCFNYVLFNLMVAFYLSNVPMIYDSSILSIMAEFSTYYLSYEIYFYSIHRLFHQGYLFKRIHSVHHRSYADHYLTAFYVHPVETLLLIFPASIIGSALWLVYRPINSNVFMAWMLTGLFHLLWSHTGADYRWLPSTLDHYLHHRYVKYNYSGKLLDGLFRTYISDKPESNNEPKD